MSGPTPLSKEERAPLPLTAEEHVWVTAWCAVASCWNQKETAPCTRWADKCLEDFRQRFRK
jgi:hypothetical protein